MVELLKPQNVPLTSALTYFVLKLNKQFWPLRMREKLIKAVKVQAEIENINPDCVKAETITRTWRYMVQAGIIPKDAASDGLAEFHKDHWRGEVLG